MSIDILKNDIKNKQIRNLYLFYGPEDYLKSYYLDALEKLILNEDLKVLNRVVIDGKADIDAIMDNCEAMPVFSDKKIVIVKNSGLFKTKSKGGEESKGKGKGAGTGLVSFLQNIPQHTCLIFYEAEIDKRLKTVETVKSNGLVVEFSYQKPAELVKWVIKVFKSFNKEIDVMAASWLVDNSELGMNEILNEINKVVLYLGDKRKVEVSDLEEACSKSIKSRIFDLTDAVAEKNSRQALKVLNEMILLKEPLPRILFMITRQFRHVLEMKLLQREGVGVGEAASRMGIAPYAAGKVLKQSKSFTVDELKRAIEECLRADEAIKTGKMSDRIAAELLIAKFSG